MANNHGVGAKYVSVNLNKSYGQQQPHHHHYNNHHSGGYGSNRSRSGGGGGGGGMVVLSRPRSSPKATGQKLSVPPPLNLPSLRKEHERNDSSGASVHSAGGISGSGSRPASSGMGWTKPAAAAVALQEKERLGGDVVSDVVDGANKGSNGVYMPPVARSGVVEPSGSRSDRVVERAAILRGEDFPSLRATLPGSLGPAQKRKESLNQKQKQVAVDDFSKEQRDGSRSSSHVDMRPQSHSGRSNLAGKGFCEGTSFQDGSRPTEQSRKQEEYFPGPLPLVRLNPRSDWADDERDTSHGLRDRDRDYGCLKNEAFWDRDFDVLRASTLPHKPAAQNHFDRPGQRDCETGKGYSGEVRTLGEGREANAWRVSSPLHKDGYGRNGVGARPSSRGREVYKENKYMASPFRENFRDNAGKRDVTHEQGVRQPWNNFLDTSSNRGTFTRERYSGEQQNRDRADAFQNGSISKGSFSSGGKGLPVNDPILNLGRDKLPFAKNEKPYLEDPFMKDLGDSSFDVRDPFPGSLLGVVKKKKEVLKQADFHDPVRESFEAELERVQKMQEEERRRIIEEQARALELARREEEERLGLAREQEEQQRRLEEEAREAAWRAEQERLEAVRRAEELRKSKEEEKHRILMEEERRKQAAKQKLQELEERIARRQAEAAKVGSSSSTVSEEKSFGMVKEREVSRVAENVDWEDGEKMVERITTPSSLDAPVPNRSLEMDSGPQFSRDSSSGFCDRGKPVSSWRKDSSDNGSNSAFSSPDMENVPHSPQRDGGRLFPKKEFFGAAGYMSSRSYYKAGIPEPHMEFSHSKAQRWNVPGDEDLYGRNNEIEAEYHESLGERHNDAAWGQGQGRSRHSPYPPYPERMYHNAEGDDYYPFGRPRYPVRQPRVLPPPSLTSMQKASYRSVADRPSPSTFLDNEMKDNHTSGIESSAQAGYVGDHQDNLGRPVINRDDEQHPDRKPASRCDSQSSVSVSSPPDSPIQLSHDDLDESGDSSILSGAVKGKEVALLGEDKEPGLSADAGEDNMMTAAGSVSYGDDEEWAVDNNEHLQQQEEYDEDEDGYLEEDEIHEVYDNNIDLTQEFEEMNLQEKDSNLILGFNEGVEVEMPSDDCEKSSRNEDAAFTMPKHSVDSREVQGPSIGTSGDGQTILPAEVPVRVDIDDSSRIFQETESAMQNLAIQPNNNAVQASTVSEPVDKVDTPQNLGVSTQPTVLPSLNMGPHISSVQTATPTTSSAPGQAEEPVKLQFGLFSGPSLIPSPVPAIQIGSIQMPLPLHPQVSPSLTHMQPSQPPIFQFGQLRYTSPISQGILPFSAHSFIQPNGPSGFTLNHNPGAAVPLQLVQGNAANNLVRNAAHSLSDSQAGLVMRSVDTSNGNTFRSNDALPAREGTDTVMLQQRQAKMSNMGSQNGKPEAASQQEVQVKPNSVERELVEGQLQSGAVLPPLASKDRDISGSKAPSQAYGGRGKRDAFAVKNSAFRASGNPEVSHVDSGGYRRPRRQRTEFRVRASNHLSSSDDINASGRLPAHSMRNGAKKIVVSHKSSKQLAESDGLGSGSSASLKMDSEHGSEIECGKEAFTKNQNTSNSAQTNLKRNFVSEEDLDVPLQSGVVRVFEQPGIEAPSDDDDFIEVRSKRQMLNDRREQRQKEIKAKSRDIKVTQKPLSTLQNNVAAARSNKISAIGGVGNKQSNPVTNRQPLAPIGTPAHKADTQADSKSQTIKSAQTTALPAVSGGEQNLASSFIFESKNKVLDDVQTSFGSWANSRIDQPVMALTQSQLDEAMRPVSFDSCISEEDHGEPNSASTSTLGKNKTFPSATSPINSLLAGGKIQFGAVTSTTVLPPSSRAVSQGIGPPGPCRIDLQVSGNLSSSENDCSIFFEKEKHLKESSAHMEDSEAEAEAAASAVAVAAITSDEISGNPLGASSALVAETKSFGGVELNGAAGSGIAGEQPSQSKAEESLSVSLPADLSVDTPPISLWPPLPSPQNSSNQMITHFPGGPPPHFPFYEMNHMLRGPMFAFGPHDESGSNQSQSQKGAGAVSGPLGNWQPGHSGVDSFYGPPTGFTGPFISPPGGIPGVQGPPHMVVYNHFAPVGQFGQVGLSFMGATYIPSGKQPDWKHNPVSSAIVGGEADGNNPSMVSAQRSTTMVPASVQHLAPGSALLPIPSPLAMFDVSPFQSSPDMPVQARWPNIPASPLQPTPLSMPLQQQPEGVLSSQFNNIPSSNRPLTAKRYPEVRTSPPSDSSRNFPVTADATVTRLPGELGLAGSSASTVTKTSSSTITAETSKPTASENMDSGFKPHSQQKSVSTQQYGNSSGYNRGGSQRTNHNSGSEWSHHRRSGFHGRNQSLGGEKGFPNTKVKQIYVAKQTSSSTSATPSS